MPTILVVDDDRSTLHRICQAFGDTGVTVETARSAGEGMHLLAARHPDVVLLEVILPDVSGLEMFQNIKLLERPEE